MRGRAAASGEGCPAHLDSEGSASPIEIAGTSPAMTTEEGGTMTQNGKGNEPVGYGHDQKGAAVGDAKNQGRPHVVQQPADRADGPATIKFTLDGQEVEAPEGETIFRTARRYGIKLPHLCYTPKPGYRPDGNCRVCMVEVEGERVLAASCLRKATPGMKVKTQTERAKTARRMVAELLMADQPAREVAHDPESEFWKTATRLGVETSRFPQRAAPAPDRSHPAMAVNLDACIQCNLCVRACREVQVNDVIGMAGRGVAEKIVFDFDDPMGASTCVACGECVQACPTGALMPSSLLDAQNVRTGFPDRSVDSVCPYCGVGCQLTYHIKDDKLLYVTGKNGPANENRLCVKGRFGFDYVHHRHRLTQPLIRKDGVAKHADDLVDPANPWTHFRPATGRRRSPASAPPRARTRRPICSRSWCAPVSAPTTSITARGCATPRRSPP
jgi:formate dehydrogenase major subunit